MTFAIHRLGADDLSWPDSGDPSFSLPFASYPRSVTVKPRPAYPHDIAIVRETLDRCESTHPLVGAVKALYVLDRDFTTGFNGLAMPDTAYKRPDGTSWDVNIPSVRDGSMLQLQGQALGIVLAAKAVPQHLSWTRYLVGHEYGHCAWYHARRLLGFTPGDKAEVDYMRVRGHADWVDGKRWHQLAIEVIANDWRVLAGIEPDFWQHDVPPPTDNEAIRAWWENAAALSAKGHPDDDHDAVAARKAAA